VISQLPCGRNRLAARSPDLPVTLLYEGEDIRHMLTLHVLRMKRLVTDA
jgi:hypothetical protein